MYVVAVSANYHGKALLELFVQVLKKVTFNFIPKFLVNTTIAKKKLQIDHIF